MAAEDAPVVVQLVDDDVAQVLEEALPLGVVRQDPGVQHVRVGDHDVPGQAHGPRAATGRVAVVGVGLDVRPQGLDQAVQLGVLVLGEGLGGEEVEGPGGGRSGWCAGRGGCSRGSSRWRWR